MNLANQKKIGQHFELMYQAGQKPWTEHGPEPSLKEFLKLLQKRNSSAKIADIGCGDGWISIAAARAGHKVWGIDSSETAIGQARETAKVAGADKNTHFQVGDALNLPYPKNFFDAAIDRGLFHHILPENRLLYFENILKALKPKSLAYLSVFSTKNPVGIGQLFTPELVEELFGKDFKTIFFEEDPFPTEAPAHLMHFIFEKK